MGNTCASSLHSAAQPTSPSSTSFDVGASAGSSSKNAALLESIEQRQHREREAGQRQLRDMVAAADASGLGLDWSALIKKAEELHRRDQEYERKRTRLLSKAGGRGRRRGRGKQGGGDGSGGGVSSRLQQNLERRRRRRADACGSFSVNLTTYRNETEVPLLRHDRPSSDKDGGSSQTTVELEEVGSDRTGSFSGALDNRSTVTSSTVPGIDEECCSQSFDSGGALSENGIHTHEALATIHE